MTFTTAEVFLFVCNTITLALYFGARASANMHKRMVMYIIEGIADKKLRAFRDGAGEVQLTNNVRSE